MHCGQRVLRVCRRDYLHDQEGLRDRSRAAGCPKPNAPLLLEKLNELDRTWHDSDSATDEPHAAVLHSCRARWSRTHFKYQRLARAARRPPLWRCSRGRATWWYSASPAGGRPTGWYSASPAGGPPARRVPADAGIATWRSAGWLAARDGSDDRLGGRRARWLAPLIPSLVGGALDPGFSANFLVALQRIIILALIQSATWDKSPARPRPCASGDP